MTNITPPQADRKAMLMLAQLPEESFESLKDGLLSADKTSDRAELAARVAIRASNIEPKSVLSIVVCLFSMETARTDKNLTTKEFVESAVMGAAAADSPTFSASEERVTKDRLLQLLVPDGPATYAAKVNDVLREHQHVFCSCRVLTDIRPIFFEDITVKPKQAVVIHTVKIAYHECGEHKEFYVALDSKDADELRHALERAAKKGATIDTLLEDAGVSNAITS